MPLTRLYWRLWLCLILSFCLISGCAVRSTVHSDQPLPNLVVVNERIHTAGQPNRKQLAGLHHDGYRLVINLSPSNSPGGVPDEGWLLARSGIVYLSIPVDWYRPSSDQFDLFSRVLRHARTGRVLVHCQLNRRASVYTFLYRVVYDGIDPEEAYDKVTEVWIPGSSWQKFARTQLQRYHIEFDF